MKTKPAKKVLVNIGCGVTVLPGFINIDKYFTADQLKEGAKTKQGLCGNASFPPKGKFVQGDILALPLKDNSVDYVECLEMLEHLPWRDVELAVFEIYRVLKEGGKATICVPDLDDMCLTWTEKVAGKKFDREMFFTLAQQFYGSQLHDGEYHTSAFNRVYLTGLLQACGFPAKNIKVTEYPHGSHPPKFKGAFWNPTSYLIIGMLTAEVKK